MMREVPSTALAVDAGQTTIKVLAFGGATLRASWPGVRTDRPVLPQVAEVVLAASGRLGVPVEAVAVGTTGLSDAESDPHALLRLCAAAGVRRMLLAHDSITSYLGALGPAHGVVVAAGTGVVTLGVGAGVTARVDGWGNIMGDAGSGYWIGRAALDAVMRAHDGRGPATALTAVVADRYPDLEQAYMVLQADPDRVRTVADLAREVARLAASDAVAGRICRDAGAELALSALTASRRCGLGDEPAICLIGSIASSDAVASAFAASLTGALPGARLTTPLGDALAGAAALLSLPDDHALMAMVAGASL